MERSYSLAEQPLMTCLEEHPFSRGLNPHHLEVLAQCARECTIAPGEYLCRQGEPADFFFLIFSGRAALEISIPHEGVLRVEIVSEGEVLGWYWLLPSCRWNLDARAITPVHALRIDGQLLCEKCEQDLALHQSVLTRFSLMVSQRLLSTQTRLIHAVS